MNKRIAIILSCIFVIIAFVASLLFVFTGDIAEQSEESISLTGTWKVISYINNDISTLIDNEFMVFNDTTALNYKEDLTVPYVSTKYEINNKVLELSDISRNYQIEKITDNILRLYENEKVYMHLVKYPNQDMSPISIDISELECKWQVVCHSGNPVSGEYLIFNDNIVEVYRNDEISPSSESSYSFNEENHLIVEAWSKDMIIHIVSNDVIVLVETDTGYNWELIKTE